MLSTISRYRTYKLKDTREKYHELFLTYGHFFACGIRAHFAAMVVSLGRVFDTDPKNSCIAGILKAAPELEQVELETRLRIQKMWDDHALHLRHEVVAHRSGSSTIEDAFKRANISLNDLETLIALSRQLLDAWARKRDCFSHNLSSVMPDLTALMNMLLRARIEHQLHRRQPD